MVWIEHLQSVNWSRAAGCAAAGYLLGCFSTGYWLVRLRAGGDVRELGSGVTGARNVGRVLGRSGFLFTLLGDFSKGALAVWLAFEFNGDAPLPALLALLAAVAGHIWPAPLHFRGGKGVATALGALLLLDYRLALTFAVLFLAGFAASRKTFLPAMFAFAGLPVAGWWFEGGGLAATLLIVLAVMILFAHRRNFADEMAAAVARHEVAPKPGEPKL
ncbi:MAG: glycerol-3-phosphate acyltransferase [Verrucomicrobiota bacterium]|nr:glycerol-3-phosphate acyltransferase [Verrucomicrobiota bacterium]